MLPTYDMPKVALSAVEARHLSSMCTENWAKFWAVKSKEHAGDLADAVVVQCAVNYQSEAKALWPAKDWPAGTAAEHVLGLTTEWRGKALAQIVQTRVDGCKKLENLEKYKWADPAA